MKQIRNQPPEHEQTTGARPLGATTGARPLGATTEQSAAQNVQQMFAESMLTLMRKITTVKSS